MEYDQREQRANNAIWLGYRSLLKSIPSKMDRFHWAHSHSLIKEERTNKGGYTGRILGVGGIDVQASPKP